MDPGEMEEWDSGAEERAYKWCPSCANEFYVDEERDECPVCRAPALEQL